LLYADSSDNAALKLADFGLAQIIKPSEMMHHACGTPGYIAPEMLQDEEYGSQVDLWSLGVILYILICGFPPFYDEDEKQLFDSIRRGNYEFISPYWDDASEQVKDLISKLLELDPAKRLTAAQVLEHEWLSASFPHKTAHNSLAIQQMRKYNGRRRLKGAVRAIIATNKIKSLVQSLGEKV
jgi:calcium/calmodulin-dependent protein kinase I